MEGAVGVEAAGAAAVETGAFWMGGGCMGAVNSPTSAQAQHAAAFHFSPAPASPIDSTHKLGLCELVLSAPAPPPVPAAAQRAAAAVTTHRLSQTGMPAQGYAFAPPAPLPCIVPRLSRSQDYSTVADLPVPPIYTIPRLYRVSAPSATQHESSGPPLLAPHAAPTFTIPRLSRSAPPFPPMSPLLLPYAPTLTAATVSSQASSSWQMKVATSWQSSRGSGGGMAFPGSSVRTVAELGSTVGEDVAQGSVAGGATGKDSTAGGVTTLGSVRSGVETLGSAAGAVAAMSSAAVGALCTAAVSRRELFVSCLFGFPERALERQFAVAQSVAQARIGNMWAWMTLVSRSPCCLVSKDHDYCALWCCLLPCK